MQRVLIADDHEQLARGLSRWVQKDGELEVVAAASDGFETLKKARAVLPDIVILDHPLPWLDTGELIAELLGISPSLQIVIYSMQNRPDVIMDLLRAGAAAYVLKSDPVEHLLAAIAALNRRSAHLSPGATRSLARAAPSRPHLRLIHCSQLATA